MRVSISSRSGANVTIGTGSASNREVLVTLSSRHKVHSKYAIRLADFSESAWQKAVSLPSSRLIDSLTTKNVGLTQGAKSFSSMRSLLGRMKFTKYAQRVIFETICLNLLYRVRSKDWDCQHNVYMVIPSGTDYISRYFAPVYELDRGEPSSLSASPFDYHDLCLDTFFHEKYSVLQAKDSCLDTLALEWFKEAGYL